MAKTSGSTRAARRLPFNDQDRRGTRHFQDVQQVVAELGRVYDAARTEEISAARAKDLAGILRIIGDFIEGKFLEERLALLEQRLTDQQQQQQFAQRRARAMPAETVDPDEGKRLGVTKGEE